MKYAIVLLAVVVLVGVGQAQHGSTGRGAGYRTDYATGRSQWSAGKKEPGSFFVTRVVDGDTLRIDREEKVRLIGVDTPETKHPTKPVQYFGKEASLFTQNAVEHRWVTLDYEIHKRDKYGRLLAYVHRSPDSFFLNAELIKQGYGFAYTRFPFRYMSEFREYETQARSEGRGLWQRDKREQPVPAVERQSGVLSAESETVAPSAPSSTIEKPPGSAVENKKVDNCKIKGNISKNGEKIYHLPGGRWYDKTKIDEADGERWFCTEDEAEKSGWRKAGS